jgi:hypothetical protein
MWDDVARLKREMTKLANSNGGCASSQRSTSNLAGVSASNNIGFRLKILQAVAILQGQLHGLDNDLGSVYWHPFYDQGPML